MYVFREFTLTLIGHLSGPETETMPKKFFRFAVLSAVFTLAAFAYVPSAPAAPPASSCDRACLEGVVNDYLAALAARDPSKVSFADNVKFTENTAKLKIGEGFWQTANGIGSFRLTFAEPAAGEAGFIGTMREWDNPVIFCLRLKVSAGKISEVEDFVVRDAGAGKALETKTPNPLFFRSHPHDRTCHARSAREDREHVFFGSRE